MPRQEFGDCKACGAPANHQLATATVSKYTDGFHGFIKHTISESEPVPLCESCYQAWLLVRNNPAEFVVGYRASLNRKKS